VSAEWDVDAITAKILAEVVASGLLDQKPAAPSPWATVAKEHGLDVGRLGQWAKARGVTPEDFSGFDAVEYRRVTS
jgi:hypothetical protein